MELGVLLAATVRARASDLFLKCDAPAAFRVDGLLRRDVLPKDEQSALLDAAFLEKVVQTVLVARGREVFDKEGEVDGAYEQAEIGRFRVNVFRQRGKIGIVFRHIPPTILSLTELNLPAAQIQKLCAAQRGLVLVTGVAGSGKSTCLAAMVDYINSTSRRHIITIEDPVEFVHEDKLSLIEQRELHLDTRSFSTALKHSVRQSPDVILVGEMRDSDTMETALSAASTGHLVLSTLHTVDAVQTVERVIGYFPPHFHELVRMQLALVLQAVISLRLLRRSDGTGRVPAVEMLMGTPTVRDLLQKGQTRQLPATLRGGGQYGAQTFGQSLKQLIDAQVISQEEALAAADSPEELRLELQGISRAGDV